MAKNIFRVGLCLLLAVGCLTGCKRSQSIPAADPNNYFKTHFQNESQFIVENIISDLAEQVYYAKFHQLPDTNWFFVSATETPASQFRAPVYDLLINLGKKHQGLKFTLSVNGPIWAPEVYDNVVSTLARAVKLSPSSSNDTPDTSLLAKLTDGTAATIENQNQVLSPALENDFSNPALHQQAALLLSAFTLRDHSGNFFEIRSPLCRITAHLAMARYLGGATYDLNGTMANAILLTLMNDQAAALDYLSQIQTNDAASASWIRALQARNTGDYRPLDKLSSQTTLSNVECSELFGCLYESIGSNIAWDRLGPDQKTNITFVRIANQSQPSVGVGNALVSISLPLEFNEIRDVYQLVHQKPLAMKDLTNALNEVPEHCFSTSSDGQTHVHVIGWGQWADFLQRHLCQSIKANYYYLRFIIGTPDEARSFAATYDEVFRGLRLHPFVRRWEVTDSASYHRAVDDCFPVTIATPQLTPADCWNHMCYAHTTTDRYLSNPNPHVNEWHNHNPLPGTVYDLWPRLDHPSLLNRGQPLLDELHNDAPNDWNLIDIINKQKYNNSPNYAQASELVGALSLYSVKAMKILAASVKDQPIQYERLLLRASDLDPSAYLNLAIYYEKANNDDKAVDYFEKSMRLDTDVVPVANSLDWLMHYYLQHSRVADAQRVADYAGETYSYSGLETEAQFFEATTNYPQAYQWYSNIADRYNDSGPVNNFCLRYKSLTGDDSYLRQRTDKIFPGGVENVGFSDFNTAPTDGVLLYGNSTLMQAAGLNSGDVIVSINGIRVHNTAQYAYQREYLTTPELDLIVWQSTAYHEIKASPPNHRFGVDVYDYHPK